MSPRLAEYVRARVPEARIERQWEAIERAGLPGPAVGSRRPWGWAAAGVLVAGLAFGAARSWEPAPSALQAGALVESAQGEVAVRLEDGSSVQLAPKSQLRLLANRQSAIELELRSGSARFDVTHRNARKFAVKAGPAEVRVIGTRFAIERRRVGAELEVSVTVTEGTVEVARRDLASGESQRIHAGESWSARIPADGQPARDAQQVKASDSAEAPVEDGLEPAEVEIAADPAEAAPPEASARKVGRARARSQGAEPAIEVFRRGNLARRAGRMREAADAYAALLASYPGDARAGLSAFELGRIRMDALDDEAGAIHALERSLAAGPGASFHEDALARIVVAQDALGRTDACRRARDRYLAAYANGVHAHALSARCK